MPGGLKNTRLLLKDSFIKMLKNPKSTNFKEELGRFLQGYEVYSKAFYQRKIKESGKYSPIISNLYRDLENFSRGGKKLRAFFVYLGYKLGAKDNPSRVLPISLAFELTQNFLLIHDDIMDNSDLRRGKETIHKVYEKKYGRHYGEGMAITLGDIAAIDVMSMIAGSDFNNEQKAQCIQDFSKVLVETVYGQALDLEYSFKRPDIAQIYKIADLKAARYSVAGPLSIGARLGGVNDSELEALVNFGLSAGLAFQLQDDILGVFGDEKTTGKSILSDIREGKNTLLIYKARELGSTGDKAIISKLWGKTNASLGDLKAVARVIKGSGALSWCLGENQNLVAKAKRQIKKITRDANLQLVFAEIADFVASREN